ncbi:MAG TPA: NAD-glutamate dehydrogenase, partial [Caulobacteraceae bacterium]|nr:NAD-glutamate dehydrogenase [Caulobacteraceae bacterium]
GNDMVNLCGPTFPRRLCAAAACETDALFAGFAAAKETLRFDRSWRAIAALDNRVTADAQLALFAELAGILRAQTYWLARRAGQRGLAGAVEGRPHGKTAGALVQVGMLINVYQPAMDELRRAGPTLLSTFEQRIVARRIKAFRRMGAPNAVATDLATLAMLTTACDLADMARAAEWPVRQAAQLYHQAGAAFGFDRLRAAAGSLKAEDSFERLAVRRLIEDLVVEQTALTRKLIGFAGDRDAVETIAEAKSLVRAWTALHSDVAETSEAGFKSVENAPGAWTFAKLTIAAASLRELVSAAR